MLMLNYLKNMIEIVFFSGIIYLFSLWLKQDKRHNLLLWFYGYCLIFLTAHLVNLSTMSVFLLYCAPFALILFVLFHQETLQRNFVSLRNNHYSLDHYPSEWLENLIRVSLTAMNNNRSLYIIIENNANLKPFLKSSYILNSPLSMELLLLLSESNYFDQQKIIWCTSHGKLIAINAEWQSLPEDPTKISWQQEALFMTLKTDTIIVKVNHSDRTFDIVLKGTFFQAVSIQQVIPFIKKHLALLTNPLQKGTFNDQSHKAQHSEQSQH